MVNFWIILDPSRFLFFICIFLLFWIHFQLLNLSFVLRKSLRGSYFVNISVSVDFSFRAKGRLLNCTFFYYCRTDMIISERFHEKICLIWILLWPLLNFMSEQMLILMTVFLIEIINLSSIHHSFYQPLLSFVLPVNSAYLSSSTERIVIIAKES